MVFEHRVLRRIFGPKREKVTGGWRKLHNENLHNLYTSPNIIRMIISRSIMEVGAGSTNGRDEKCIQYFGWKTSKEDTTWTT
jgi:hypothetical protein